MNLTKGDKLVCNETINNIYGYPLFYKDEIYEVLYVDIFGNPTLNHILYGNEYMDFKLEYIESKFTKLSNLDREIFVCTCHSLEHQFTFNYDPEIGLYCEPHLSTSNNFIKRLIIGIKYIFGYKSKYGAWDEFIFKKEDLNKLNKLIK